MSQEIFQDKEFIVAVFSVGIPVVRGLYTDIINRIKDKTVQEKFHKKLDNSLPETPLGGKKLEYEDKKFYMWFKPITTEALSRYNYEKETIGKILEVTGLSATDKVLEYVYEDRNCTFSAPFNYNRMFMETNKKFISELIEALPEDDDIRDIQFKIDESLGIYFIYQDGINYGLTIDVIV